MAKRKNDQTLPMNTENDTEPSSSITYANEVVAIIAGLAASEVEGIAGMVNVNSGLKGKNRNVTRGVKVEVGTEEVSVDLYLNVEYGTPIQRAAHNAQESVKKSIESMTGLHVVRVDVHVMGVSFEKENNALQAGAGKAVLEAGEQTASALKEQAEPAPEAEKQEKPEASAETEVSGTEPQEDEQETAAEPVIEAEEIADEEEKPDAEEEAGFFAMDTDETPETEAEQAGADQEEPAGETAGEDETGTETEDIPESGAEEDLKENQD